MRILVTGASGFVGSELIPRLLRDGHAVRALARDPERPERSGVAPAGVAPVRGAAGEPAEVAIGDVLTGAGLARALADVEVAYYLIHSMERPRGEERSPFPERERRAAENFARAARAAGVRRIVYLGGPTAAWLGEHAGALGAGAPIAARRGGSGGGSSIGSGIGSGGGGGGGGGVRQGADGGARQLSAHLRSRETVARTLREAIPETVVLRASIVIGARSRSFRFLVRLVERLPVLALPSWHTHRTRPIDGRDMIEMLSAAATVTRAGGRSLDVGGPEALSYGQMLRRIAELMLLARPAVGLGLSATPIAARIAAAIAREDPELVIALMESLQGDLLPDGPHGDAHLRAAQLLGVELHSFDSAVERALREWESVERLRAR